MSTSVRKFSDSRGVESVVLKMDDTPLFWANLYATIEYRNAQKSPNTIEKVLRTIGMFYEWAKSEHIDLDERLVSGQFLSIADVDSLSFFLRLKSKAQKALVEKSLLPSNQNRKIKSLECVRISALTANTPALAFAGNEEIATRLRITADYLRFHLTRRLGTIDEWTRDAMAMESFSKNTIAYLKQLTPKVRASTLNEDLQGLSQEEIKVTDTAFTPDTITNPFRAGFYQNRNYLIWRLLFETGMRRHELIAIKVEDVDYGQHRIVIRISKTMARTVPISQNLSDFFHTYIMDYWSKISSKATSHGYLITRKDGGHLDEGSINLIFQTVREKVHKAPINLTPHSLRRTWNDRLSANIDNAPADQKITPEQEQQIRNRLMGWSSGSAQAERYAKRHIKRKADQIAESLANNIIFKTEPDNDG